ncbi:MAG TPA: sulfotransferase domain-containing protein, partial [Opitutus sp.]|nr:sulfotransferase domain-containing protein [Opitutus sp.]
MKGIVWLASYPKSGNTWFRTFLTNFLRDGDAPAAINELAGGPIASARIHFDEAVGYDSGEMTYDEIDALRPDVYRQWAREAQQTPFCKIHDAYTFLPDGRPLSPPDATECALYFVRNPLDVAVSFAH